MRCMHPPPLLSSSRARVKALEPESQESECTPLPRTPAAMSQRHKGQSLESATPSTLSARRSWMSWRPQLFLVSSAAWTTQVSARGHGIGFGIGRAAHVAARTRVSAQGRQLKGAPWLGGRPAAARVPSFGRMEVLGAAVPPVYSTGRGWPSAAASPLALPWSAWHRLGPSHRQALADAQHCY
jgi:hypothetical protein